MGRRSGRRRSRWTATCGGHYKSSMDPRALLPFLPMVAVLLGGIALWSWVGLSGRPDPLGLGRAKGREGVDPLALVLVAALYLPMGRVVAQLMGASIDEPLSLVRASFVSNLLTVGVGLAVLYTGRLRPLPLVATCPDCETTVVEVNGLCAVCGATVVVVESPTLPVLAAPSLRSLRLGLIGLLLAYPLVVLALVASAPLRSVEKLHPFLKQVLKDPQPSVVWWVVLAAVVAAPLVEELVFRVAIQGLLRRAVPAGAAIGVTAVLFAAIHGWPDMIGILPLALVLGVLYDRTRDYAAVVVTHMAFNGLMIWSSLQITPELLEELERAQEAAEAAFLG
jgi:membrane protease YdiL (CAAX protease family)